MIYQKTIDGIQLTSFLFHLYSLKKLTITNILLYIIIIIHFMSTNNFVNKSRQFLKRIGILKSNDNKYQRVPEDYPEDIPANDDLKDIPPIVLKYNKTVRQELDEVQSIISVKMAKLDKLTNEYNPGCLQIFLPDPQYVHIQLLAEQVRKLLRYKKRILQRSDTLSGIDLEIYGTRLEYDVLNACDIIQPPSTKEERDEYLVYLKKINALGKYLLVLYEEKRRTERIRTITYP